MIGNRIIEGLKVNRLSVNKLKDLIDMSQTTLNNQLRETSPLTAETIEKILPYISNISAEWILRGEGSMEKGLVNQIVGRFSSCGDGDIFNGCDGDVKLWQERCAKLEEEKERLLSIIESLTKK